MEYLTAADMVTGLGTRVRDTGDSRWSAAEKRAALQAACRRMGGYKLPCVYDGLSIAGDTYGYALPAHVSRVVAVGRRESSESTPYDMISWWQETPDPLTGAPYLWIDFEGSDWALRVYYVVSLPVVSAADTTINDASGMTATATSVTVASVAGWPEPGWAKINDEVITYTAVDAVNVKLTGCTRGVWGTAGSHADTDDVYCVVPAWAPDLYEVLYWLAEAELFRQALNDSPGEGREESRWQLRWANQQAGELAQGLRRFRSPRRWRLAREALTWKGPEVNDWV